MSFGFGVGDFIAVGKLVTDIVLALKDSGGSRTEYQDLVRELECLRTGLIHLDKLTATGASPNLTAIKYTALSCRRPLEEFLTKMSKYDGSLGIRPKGNPIKGVIDKIKFPFAHKEDIKNLQVYLSVHVGTINMLLAEYGLETMQLAAERAETGQLHTNKWFENTGALLGRMQSSVVFQGNAILRSMAMLDKVYKMVSGELKASLQSLENAAARVCISTQQIYAVVLEIQSSIAAAPDVRWTFFQDPILVEDALGRKFPLPSEYDYSLLEAIIKHKFQDGPGARQVAAGDYEIMDAKNRQIVISANSSLRPGCSITMAILIRITRLVVLTDAFCPMLHCLSSNITALPGGGRQCCNCGVWFDKSEKKLSSLANLRLVNETSAVANQSDADVNTYREKTSGRKRKRTSKDEDSNVSFKNVKLAARKVEKKHKVDTPQEMRCNTCKFRRIKCDEQRPACTQCVRAKKLCTGYLPPPQVKAFENVQIAPQSGAAYDPPELLLCEPENLEPTGQEELRSEEARQEQAWRWRGPQQQTQAQANGNMILESIDRANEDFANRSYIPSPLANSLL